MTAYLNGFRIDDLDAALTRLGARAGKLRGARLFITGGTGTIGQWLLSLLVHARMRLSLDFEVVALSRDRAHFLDGHSDFAGHDWLRFRNGDICDFDFPCGAFTHVVHAAADTSLESEQRPRERADSIIDGTRRVLAFARASGASRLLFLSSGAVYGKQPHTLDRIDETFTGAPDALDYRNAYGEAKRIAEMYCSVAAREDGLESVIARIFAIAGPGLPLDAHFAIGNFVRDALAGGPIRVNGDGTAVRTYLYSGDIAVWLAALLVDGRSGVAYNVGSDAQINIADLARLVASTLGGGIRVEILGKPEPDAPRSRYAPSIDRARGELGLDAWTPLATAIARMSEFARRNDGVAPLISGAA